MDADYPDDYALDRPRNHAYPCVKFRQNLLSKQTERRSRN